MIRHSFENAIFYNAELDEIYIFQNDHFETVYLLGYGTVWHYIGEL